MGPNICQNEAEYSEGVQKNKENVQVQNMVCSVGAQPISIHLLLTATCSFCVKSVDQ